jgi:hypothetical protein
LIISEPAIGPNLSRLVATILSSQPLVLMSDRTMRIWGWILSVFGKTAVNWPSLYYLKVGCLGFPWSEALDSPDKRICDYVCPFGHDLGIFTDNLYFLRLLACLFENKLI